jgi:hypothetical protein
MQGCSEQRRKPARNKRKEGIIERETLTWTIGQQKVSKRKKKPWDIVLSVRIEASSCSSFYGLVILWSSTIESASPKLFWSQIPILSMMSAKAVT